MPTEGDWMGGGLVVTLLAAAAWWWGRARVSRPDPADALTEPARGAWKVAPAAVIVGLCVTIAAALAKCGR